MRILLATAATALLAAPAAAAAQAPHDAGFDSTAIALVYHKLSGDALDLEDAAGRSDAVRRAAAFDRRDATAAEVARLRTALAAAPVAREFVVRVNDEITPYDHDRGEFSIGLFRPGYFVPMYAFHQEYHIVFANADRVRAIAMAKEPARAFDAQLNAIGRRVTNEIRFRVTGGGDPSGAVTGPHVIRAELLGVRLLDEQARVVYAPTIAPGPPAASALGGRAAPAFDPVRADVAGFRVGVTAKDMEVTLRRLFGPVSRGAASRATPMFAATLEVNPMGCINVPGRRHNARPGSVCVTAFLDAAGVVRAVRVERVFPAMDAEVFRRSLVQKYGPVAGAASSNRFVLGWGPPVDASLVYDGSGPHTALTASYEPEEDFISRGMNRAQDIHVVLHLVDAVWAASHRTR